jgi:hypothetical protein
MSRNTATDSPVIQRCAVCKIDLKGRFSFIDKEFLDLTGYSDEELLGKPVEPFFEVSSRDLISKLLNEGSHYETIYNSAPLTIINKNHETVKVSATMFLNFIGGNPANFQFILSSHVIPQRVKAVETTDPVIDQSYPNFVSDLAEIKSDRDWQKIVDCILAFSSAGQAALYRFEKGSLVPLATRIDDSQAEFTGTKISDTTELHEKVAKTEADYIFTDESSVRKAVEDIKSAPNEFLSTFSCSQRRFLLRLVFEENIDPKTAAIAIDRAKTGAQVISKIFFSNPEIHNAAKS